MGFSSENVKFEKQQSDILNYQLCKINDTFTAKLMAYSLFDE
jgi:hypothetical protein